MSEETRTALWRCARGALERALCSTFAAFGGPVILRSTYAEVVAQGCTGAELLELRHVADRDFPRVARVVCALLRCKLQPTRAKMLCYGSRAAPDRVKPVFRLPNGDEAAGIWSAHARLAVVRFGQAVPIRRVLVHECAHALIHHFAGGFDYPFAILEGYAMLIESMVVTGRPPEPTSRRTGPAHAHAQGRCMTVQELLRFDWPQGLSATSVDYDAFLQSVVCFMGFLGELSNPHGQLVKNMLYELQEARADTWDKVYEWLLRFTGLSAAALEGAFLTYVTRNCGYP